MKVSKEKRWRRKNSIKRLDFFSTKFDFIDINVFKKKKFLCPPAAENPQAFPNSIKRSSLPGK